MKKNISFLMLLISILSFSQIKYEKAYFILNSDQRVDCWIKNSEWKNTPSSFEYKLTENDKSARKSITDVKQFEIYNQTKFVRRNVKIDKSNINDINNLSVTRNPEFQEKQLFLKELVSGDINLYVYNEENSNIYFYQIGNGNIEQLIYKSYSDKIGYIAYNEDYKKQLEKILGCPTISSSEIQQVEYNEKQLENIFIKYYKCTNQNYVEKFKKQRKGKFNLNIRPRVNFQSLDFSNSRTNENYTMGSKTTFGVGLEAEFILPINKNKWSIIMEPTYQYYKTEKITDDNFYSSGAFIKTYVDYKSIELPIGIRHYMYLNDKSKLFINAQLILDYSMNSTIKFMWNDNHEYRNLKIESYENYAFGVGYNYNNKYAVEARLLTDRNLFSKYYDSWTSKYSNFSLIFSYNIF
jgi:hypothetical protein